MTTERKENSEQTQADPFANMIQFYDNWTKAWANSMSDMVASPRFAETMAQQTEGSLEFWSLVDIQNVLNGKIVRSCFITNACNLLYIMYSMYIQPVKIVIK